MAYDGSARSRAARWLVPVAVVGVVAAGVVVDSAVAGADPSLAPRSAAELLATVARAQALPFSGDVTESADLGFPALPGGSSTSLSPQSLLTGTHTARVWYAGPQQMRVALSGDLAESDVVRNGRDLWVWSSNDYTVTHATLPTVPGALAPTPSIDPATAAQRALAAIDPTTSVTVDGTSRVAGRPVYELVLSPRTDSSLVGQIRIAVDSETSTPMRVQVVARGASSPAFETAFTSITFGTPDSSVFAFTPPAGSKVTEAALPTRATRVAGAGSGPSSSTPGRPRIIGTGWTTVVELPDVSMLTNGAAASGSSTSAAALNVLLRSTTAVTGSFGSGRLLQTTLLTALLLPDGRVYVGAVTPSVLEAAASTR
jgi:outer membrane lipoprotein-sorting protein